MPQLRIVGGDFDTNQATFDGSEFVLRGESLSAGSLQSFSVDTPTPRQVGGWGMRSEFNPLGILAAAIARVFGGRKRSKMDMPFSATFEDGRRIEGVADGRTIGLMHAAFDRKQAAD